MAINRWGVNIRRGQRVSAHHPRGGSIEGTVTRVHRMQGYGLRAALDNGSDISIDDVYKVHKDALFKALTAALNEWCDFHGIDRASAGEILRDRSLTLTATQRAWLTGFLATWDASEF